jgi:hypothetical protein
MANVPMSAEAEAWQYKEGRSSRRHDILTDSDATAMIEADSIELSADFPSPNETSGQQQASTRFRTDLDVSRRRRRHCSDYRGNY